MSRDRTSSPPAGPPSASRAGASRTPAVEETGSSRASRLAALAGAILFAAFAFAWLAAGWNPDPRTWGVHALAFLPRAWLWVAAAAFVALALSPVARRVASAGLAAGGALLSSPRRRIGAALGLGIAFALLRLRFQFLGDGIVWFDKIEQREIFHHFEPLSTALAAAVAHACGFTTAAAWPAIAFGVAYVLATAHLCRALWTEPAPRALAWLLLLAHPALLLFFGYLESYPLLLLLQVLFAIAALRAVDPRRWLVVPVLVLGLGIASHLQAVGWLPALFVLPWLRAHAGAVEIGGSAPRRRGQWRALGLGSAVCVLALAVGLVVVRVVGASPVTLLAQLRGDSGLGALNVASLLSWQRLVDLGNEILLVVATALLLLVPAAIAGARRRPRPAAPWIAIACLLPGPLLFAALVPPRIGGARDWDLFLSLVLPAVLLAVEMWRQAWSPGSDRDREPRGAIGRALAGRALGFAVVTTLAWLAVNCDTARAARRMLVLQDPRGTFGNFARGYANETLGIYFRDRDAQASRNAYTRAVTANPANPRYWNNLAIMELRLEKVAAARVAFRRAYDLGMHDWFLLHNLGLCELQLGDPTAAEGLFDELVRGYPKLWQGYANRGQARLELGRPAAALPDLERACQMVPRDADLQYRRGLALRDLGRAPEARQAFEAALRLDVRCAPAREALARLDGRR